MNNRHQALARTGDRPSDFDRLGIDSKTVAIWEDGMRTDGNKGSFEWWYFDTHLDDGSSVVIIFYTKPMLNLNHGLEPIVSVEVNRPGVEKKAFVIQASPADFTASKVACNVSVGENYFRGDLHNYHIHVAHDDLTLDVGLKGQVPSWRPGTGHMYFGEHDENYFAWLASVPQGEVTLDLAMGNKTEHLTGIGYHDHNWGNASPTKLINHWHWGRAKAGAYSIVASHIYTGRAYGDTELTIFMLAKDGKIIADNAANVSFRLEDEHTDEKSGKPVANIVAYEYSEGGDTYRISYQRKDTIVDDALIDNVKGIRHVLAKLAHFDGSYLRFTGNVRLQHFVDGKKVEDLSDPGIWELMYFGRVR